MRDHSTARAFWHAASHTLHAELPGFDDLGSGIREYFVAVGTAFDPEAHLAWRSVGASAEGASAEAVELPHVEIADLPQGAVYLYVKAIDNAGLTTEVKQRIVIEEEPPPPPLSEPPPSPPVEPDKSYDDTFWLIWMFVTFWLIFFMQVGFAMLEAGTVHQSPTIEMNKNIVIKSLRDTCIGIIGIICFGIGIIPCSAIICFVIGYHLFFGDWFQYVFGAVYHDVLHMTAASPRSAVPPASARAPAASSTRSPLRHLLPQQSAPSPSGWAGA